MQQFNSSDALGQGWIQYLLDQLQALPESWGQCLVPTKDKAPKRLGWGQYEYTTDAIADALINGETLPNKKGALYHHTYNGVGLKLGKAPDYFVAIDLDGNSAVAELIKLSGLEFEQALPKTVAVTSGREGRAQHIYRVPKGYVGFMHPKGYPTGVKSYNAHKKRDEDEQLEIRFSAPDAKDGQQSVILGKHPMGSTYRWLEGRSPADIPVAWVPRWALRAPGVLNWAEGADTSTDPGKALQCLSTISNRDLSYEGHTDTTPSWFGILAALHECGVDKELARLWSATSEKHDDQTFDQTWDSLGNYSGKKNGLGSLIAWARAEDPKFRVSGTYQDAKSSTPLKGVEPKWDTKRLGKELGAIAEGAPSEGLLQAKLLDLATQSGHNPFDVKRLYDAITSEAEQQESITHAAQNLVEGSLRDIPKDVEAGLFGGGGQLAVVLRGVAGMKSIPVEALSTAMIPALGSLVSTSATLMIDPYQNRTARTGFQAAIIAPSGKGKSDAAETIMRYIHKRDAQAAEDYRRERAEFDQNLEQVKPSERDLLTPDQPEPPSQRHYVIDGSDSTPDAIVAVAAGAKNAGRLLIYTAEGISLNNKNPFGNGGRDGLFLAFHDMGPLKASRKSQGLSVYCPVSGINQLMGAQEGTLAALQGDYGDNTGEWARWLKTHARFTSRYMPTKRSPHNWSAKLDEIMVPLMDAMDNHPERTYFLPDEVYEILAHCNNQLTERQEHWEARGNPGLETAMAKLKTYLNRLVLLLHIVNEYLDGKQVPDENVTTSAVIGAWEWIQYYQRQCEWWHLHTAPEEKLTGDLAKLFEYLSLTRKGEPTELRVIRANRGKKGKKVGLGGTPEIRALCQGLVDAGKAEWVEEGVVIKCCPLLPPVAPMLPLGATAENTMKSVSSEISSSNVALSTTPTKFSGTSNPDKNLETLDLNKEGGYPTGATQLAENTVDKGVEPVAPGATKGNKGQQQGQQNAQNTMDKGFQQGQQATDTPEQTTCTWFPGKNDTHSCPKEAPYSSVAQSKSRSAKVLRIPLEPTKTVAGVRVALDGYEGLLRIGDDLGGLGIRGHLIAADSLSEGQVMLTARVTESGEPVDYQHIVEDAEIVYYSNDAQKAVIAAPEAGSHPLRYWRNAWADQLEQGLVEDDDDTRLAFLAEKAKQGLITPVGNSDRQLIAELKKLE